MTKVRMVLSAAEYVAGEEYDLDEDLADRFIVLGYAEGELSRDYDEQERESIRKDSQGVAL
jgi:hypothetical protein